MLFFSMAFCNFVNVLSDKIALVKTLISKLRLYKYCTNPTKSGCNVGSPPKSAKCLCFDNSKKSTTYIKSSHDNISSVEASFICFFAKQYGQERTQRSVKSKFAILYIIILYNPRLHHIVHNCYIVNIANVGHN